MNWEREVIAAGPERLVAINSHELTAAHLVRACQTILDGQQNAADERARLIAQHRDGLIIIERLRAAQRDGRKSVRIDHLLIEVAA